jgi:membrane protease YdiL (CAAX protease family)
MLAPFLTTTLMHWAIVLPLILFLARGRPHALPKILLLFFAAVVCDFALWLGSSWPVLGVGQWNWSGKILAAIAALGFIRAMPWSEASGLLGRGFRFPVWQMIAVAGLLTAIQIAAQFYYQSTAGFSAETLAYQALIPGISEEIVYRAMLQGGLNAVMIQRWSIFGVKAGWSLPVVALLFALGHGLYIDDNWLLQTDILSLATTFICGLLFGYLVALTGAIWWSAVAHNGFNLLGWAWQMAR